MLLRLMLLLSIILCTQFAQESRLEHEVLSKISDIHLCLESMRILQDPMLRFQLLALLS